MSDHIILYAIWPVVIGILKDKLVDNLYNIGQMVDDLTCY